MITENILMMFLPMILLCDGCVYTPIEIPPLPETSQTCQKIEPCPKLDMPEPIPKNLSINIKNGKVVSIDEGGEQLIRSYAGTRKAIKQLWLD